MNITRARWRKIFMRMTLAVGVVLFGLMLVLVFTVGVHTEPFKDAQGQLVPDSIAVMERVEIGGVAQMLWIRGVSTENPALILLSGGPGASESALFRHYVSDLEQHFLMVYWDQRGAGRSI